MILSIQHNTKSGIGDLPFAFVIGSSVTLGGIYFVHFSIPFLVILVAGILIASGSEAKKDGDKSQSEKLISIGIALANTPLLVLLAYGALILILARAYT